MFNFHKSKLEGAFSVENFTVNDPRGRFTKVFEKDIYLDGGIAFSLNEAFISTSAANVVRGLHFQTNNPQAKLVTVIEGRAIDYIVDLRPDSKTFLEWDSFELTEDNAVAVYVPRGFAHGFVSLQDSTRMLYLCEGKYDGPSDTGVLFDEPRIGIELPIKLEDAVRSKRDLTLQTVDEYIKKPMKV